MKKAVTCFAVFSILMTMMSAVLAAGLTGRVIHVKSFATGKLTEQNDGVRRGQAKRAALANAQLELFQEAKRIRFDAKNSVGDLIANSEIVSAEMDYAIKSQSEISEKYFDSGACEVVLELPIFGLSKSVAAAAFAPYKADEKIPFPQSNIKKSSGTNYTGLIVDCRDFDLQSVLSPFIQSKRGETIYTRQNLDIDKILVGGMVHYSNSLTDIRAGNKPLVVKALKVLDAVNPVISNRDASKILKANQTAHFLDNCAVVFVH